jgi:hypothetical protein
VERRGWTAAEYLDRGVSGAKDRRPALEEVLKFAVPREQGDASNAHGSDLRAVALGRRMDVRMSESVPLSPLPLR